MTSDHRVAAVNRIANHRCRLNNSVQDDGETMTFVLLRDLPEFFCAVAIEFQLDRPPFVAVKGVRFTHPIDATFLLLFYQQPRGCRFFVLLGNVLVVLDFVFRRNNFSALVDRAQSFAIVGIDQTELELGYFGQLLARFLNLRRVQSWDLDQDSILADGADDWFPRAEVVNAFADDFDRLIKQAGRDRLVLVELLELDQERSGALDVEPKGNLLLSEAGWCGY